MISDHVAATNHVIGWQEAKLIDQEQNKTTPWLKEAIWIRSRGKNSMYKDKGVYKLNNIYHQIILKRQSGSDHITTRPNERDCCVSVQTKVNKVPERN